MADVNVNKKPLPVSESFFDSMVEDGKYAKELEAECYTDIVKYGVAFCKKSCEVRKG